MQFRLVECISHHFDGESILQAGDYGVNQKTGRPLHTARAEKVLAEFFHAEDACLVRGAGSGAIRSLFMAMAKPNQEILLHKAPIYPTTAVTIRAMGLKPVFIDLNHPQEINKADVARAQLGIIQHARQQMEDRYSLATSITSLKKINPSICLITDENYLVCKVERIGIELGADASTFSTFKLFGPEGVGCILSSRKVIDAIRKDLYSGGSQVQGVEALDTLRSMVFAPVAFAIQKEVVDETVKRIKNEKIAGVRDAYIANAQSRVILVEFEKSIAKKVLQNAVKLGAAPHPVGSESRYEIAPMFYRVSGTFLVDDSSLADTMIRINPMRSGSDLIMDILTKSIEQAG
ncbi:MAG TPA: aminotransferase class I/II-fold pyridoxal phosphate-dependent enzyme [Anaerolineaceae bacterium]|nr:aminotransferase class I/II-fold pyridoxal phosphate-dependent enzyme [Anaerolineaceae bacterium]